MVVDAPPLFVLEVLLEVLEVLEVEEETMRAPDLGPRAPEARLEAEHTKLLPVINEDNAIEAEVTQAPGEMSPVAIGSSFHSCPCVAIPLEQPHGLSCRFGGSRLWCANNAKMQK